MKLNQTVTELFYRFLKRDKRFVYYKKLMANLKMSRTELSIQQNADLRKLIEHAYQNTAYYRDLMDYFGIGPQDIQTRDDLHKLPILTKQLIKDNLDGLRSKDNFGKNMLRITSGGSTGELGIMYRSKFFEEMSRASWLRNNAMIGWFPGDKSAWIWTSPIEHATYFQGIKVRLGMWLNKRIFLNAFDYSVADFPIWYKKIKSFGPKVIFGNPSVILEFSQFLLQHQMDLPSIKLVVTTTEKLKNRETIARAFEASVHDQYGCSEVIAIGIENEPNQMVFTDDVVLVKTTDEHEFLLTPLFSYGFPLINYKVGDMGEIEGVHMDTHLFPFPKINLKIGRITDKFLTKRNRKISTSSLGSYLASQNLGIKEHQLIQRDYTLFYVNYVPLKNTAIRAYKKKLRKCLEQYFGPNLDINFNEVDKLPLEQSGKRLMFKRTFMVDL